MSGKQNFNQKKEKEKERHDLTVFVTYLYNINEKKKIVISKIFDCFVDKNWFVTFGSAFGKLAVSVYDVKGHCHTVKLFWKKWKSCAGQILHNFISISQVVIGKKMVVGDTLSPLYNSPKSY